MLKQSKARQFLSYVFDSYANFVLFDPKTTISSGEGFINFEFFLALAVTVTQ